jgi:DNA transposition AAA+ family ATPase
MIQLIEKPARSKLFNPDLRDRLEQYRASNSLTLNELAKELDSHPTALSKYLNGKPEGDVAKIESIAEDVLKTAGRRSEVKIKLFPTSVTRRVAALFEQIRKTDDFGLIHGAAGLGKSRAIDAYAADHPTTIALELNRWQRAPFGIEELLFQTLETNQWPGNVRRVSWMVERLRRSRRLIIVDNAQRITSGGLEWLFDFHDATGCPIALVGNPEVMIPIRKNDQQFSRIGCVREVSIDQHADVAAEMLAQVLPEWRDDQELLTCATKVVKERGHLRALRKQLVLTRELLTSPKLADQPVLAFRVAHTQLVRDYSLEGGK